MVDVVSVKCVEDILVLLCKSLGFLLVVLLMLENLIELILIEWVCSKELLFGFVLMDEVELKVILEDGGVICCKKQDLFSDEIVVYIEVGKLVIKLVLDW